MRNIHHFFLRLYLWKLRVDIQLTKDLIAKAQESIKYDESCIRQAEMELLGAGYEDYRRNGM